MSPRVLPALCGERQGNYHSVTTKSVTKCLNDEASFALTLITTRPTILPKRLFEPGPSAGQVNDIFRAANGAERQAQTEFGEKASSASLEVSVRI